MKDVQADASERRGWSDEQVELLVGSLLRLGVIIAALVAIAGGIPYLIANGAHPTTYAVFDTRLGQLATVRGILHGAFHFESAAIVQLGILLLIATPVARVALSLFAFAKQHDRTYIVITAIVLGILVWSLSGGSGL